MVQFGPVIGLDVLGLQVAQPVVAKRFYDALGPPPVTVQRSGPDPGGYVVSEPGIKEGPKGILAGSYVKPAVHLVQDFGHRRSASLLDPLTVIYCCLRRPSGCLPTSMMMVQEPLARFRMVPRIGIPLTDVMSTIIPVGCRYIQPRFRV